MDRAVQHIPPIRAADKKNHTETSKKDVDLARAQMEAGFDLAHPDGDSFESRRALRHAFAAFDADGDGYLTKDEVVAALTRVTGSTVGSGRRYFTHLSKERALATWERWRLEYDANKDGKIAYDELANDYALTGRL